MNKIRKPILFDTISRKTERVKSMTITTRRLDQETYSRAVKYLQQAGQQFGNNLYGHFVILCGDVNDGQMLDALVQLKNSKITIERIWGMEHCHKKGMVVAKNPNGEKGKYAQLLGEKYINRFLEHLSTIDVESAEEQHFSITADLVKKVEKDIDNNINPERITEADINAYDRFEMTQYVEQALRHFCKGIDEEDYIVTYDRDTQAFNIELCTSELSFGIPLADIVRRKWEIKECLGKASISCAGDLYNKADERKRREEHYIQQLLELAIPNIRKIAGDDQERFEGTKEYFLKIIETQIILYDLGRTHSEAGNAILSCNELVSKFGELESIKHKSSLIDMLYLTYCDGFVKLNGDTLLSGGGSIRLPDIF